MAKGRIIQRTSAGDPKQGIKATGGTVTDIEQNGVEYRVHTFTSVGASTFEVTNISSSDFAEVEYIIVGGGGAGASGQTGGGGGAGGLLFGFEKIAVGSYSVFVGAGGDSVSATYNIDSNNGEDSSFYNLTSLGGGGSNSDTNGFDGGSGGGAGGRTSQPNVGGLSLQGQGNNGGNSSRSSAGSERAGGGGGGAGAIGEKGDVDAFGGRGGEGRFFDWVNQLGLGENGYLAGGGAGASEDTPNNGARISGGQGGGGESHSAESPQDGVSNTGGGGGAGGYYSGHKSGGNGGSGIVLVRYKLT